jgi:hypothetical protein
LLDLASVLVTVFVWGIAPTATAFALALAIAEPAENQ